jgi:pimeloyl-ACP methyl ester carboxylesterase
MYAANPQINEIAVDRDWVFFDQRGAGRSFPALRCERDKDYLRRVQNCWEKFVREGIDLSQYNSARSARDIEELRKALGVKQWNLWGISYGSRLAFAVARDFPASVYAIIHDGPSYPEGQEIIDDFRGTDVAINRLFSKCVADAACASKSPVRERRYRHSRPAQRPARTGRPRRRPRRTPPAPDATSQTASARRRDTGPCEAPNGSAKTAERSPATQRPRRAPGGRRSDDDGPTPTFADATGEVAALAERLPTLSLADEHRIAHRLATAARTRDGRAHEKALADVAAALDDAEQHVAARRAAVPTISYPAELPVSARRADIAAAIRDHQVVIVAGETGSGKTTQIPKICLELGLGVRGMIGHTQPRRLAARTVAARIAEELHTDVGDAVGWKVRFTDQVGENTLVKLMTDGILLAELAGDRMLRGYDTLIIDEAHERSLNIDFILGYLAKLLPRRPDLKLVITSATLHPKSFAHHFPLPGRPPPPIIEVSGRTYPVEFRYRPVSLYAGAILSLLALGTLVVMLNRVGSIA